MASRLATSLWFATSVAVFERGEHGVLRYREPAAAYTRFVARLRTDATRASEVMKALLGLAAARNLWMSRTKVAKLLYLADLRSVERDGVSGSGVVWQWRHYGPFSNSLQRVESDLVANGDIKMDVTSNWHGSVEYHLSAPPIDRSSAESSDRFLEHLDAVVAEHGHHSATELMNLTYQTEPMREAQANGQREAILDLGERRPIPDATETLAQFQRMLDDHVADDDPAPSGCSEEVLEPLRAARARANEILLGE